MTLPEPLTPPDCDLRGLEYMPLLGQRLFGSEFDALANDSEWRAGLTLWWAAWTQCPAASLPDDDTALCRLADLGRDVKTWKKLRARAMHGFVKCSDGRLYNPTLAQQALVAWDKRVKERERKAKWRADQDAKKQGQNADVPRDTTRTEQGQDATVRADGTGRDGTGRDDIKEDDEDAGARASPPAVIDPFGQIGDLTSRFARAAGVAVFPNRSSFADQLDIARGWADLGLDPETEIIPALSQAAIDNPGDRHSLRYFAPLINGIAARKEASRHGRTRQASVGITERAAQRFLDETGDGDVVEPRPMQQARAHERVDALPDAGRWRGDERGSADRVVQGGMDGA